MYCQINDVYKYIDEFKKTINPNSWDKVYSGILKFFEEYLSQDMHKDRTLMAITEKEVNDFIDQLPYKHNTKINYYRALKKFFNFLAKKEVTQPFFVKVKDMKQQKVNIKYIPDFDVDKIVNFIKSPAKFEQRLLLALFLYSGLSRKYISNLSFQQITDDMRYFRFNGRTKIPIKDELRQLLLELQIKNSKEYSDRFYDIDEDTISKEVKYISKNTCGCGYTPTDFSNTFILKTLGEDKWTNIFTVSKLTNESLSTIAKHVNDDPSWLIAQQQILLQKWK